jgi:uncharacterized membrane protein YkvA (DUF1232 family)
MMETPELNPADESQKKDFINNDDPIENKGLKISESWAYQTFVKIANRIIHKPLSVFRLIKQVISNIQRYDSVKELTKDVKDHMMVMVRLVKAYAKGEYRGISFQGILGSLAALIYFVAPLDFIPDFLIVGLVDDVAIIMWVYSNYRKEIEAFLAWEDDKKLRIELSDEETRI